MKIKLYVYSVIAGAGALGLFTLLQGELPQSYYVWGILGLLFVAQVLSERFPIPIAPRITVSVSEAAAFATTFLLPPAGAILAMSPSYFLARRLARRPTLFKTLFNSAEVAIRVGLGRYLFRILSGGTIALTLKVALAATATAVFMYTLNLSLVSGAVSLEKAKPLRSVWLMIHNRIWVQEVALYTLGFGLAFILSINLWLVFILAVPIALIYRSFEDTVKKAELSEKLSQQMEELKAYQAQLVEQAKLASIGVLASGVAHEIHNPLFILLGRAEMLIENPQAHFKSERSLKDLQVIKNMGERIQKITRALLGFARSGNPNICPVDIHQAVDETIELISKQFASKGIEIFKDYHKEPIFILGNRAELEQVFLNLMLNARDAMPNGGVITIKTEFNQNKAYISFSDTGVGISQENLKHLFEPFFTTKEPGKGTGLGLWMCYQIAKRHKGSIKVQSQLGKGATFTLEFPVVDLKEASQLAAISDSDSQYPLQ